MKPLVKYIIIAFVLATVIYLCIRLLNVLVFSGKTEEKHSMKDVIEHYNSNEKEITELANLFVSNIPNNKGVLLGLGTGKDLLDVGIFSPDGSVIQGSPNFGGHNVPVDSEKIDSFCRILGWPKETLNILKNKLEKVGCKSISSGEPIEIEYKYSGFGLYSYLIFSRPLSDSTIKIFNNRLGDTVIRSNVLVRHRSSP